MKKKSDKCKSPTKIKKETTNAGKMWVSLEIPTPSSSAIYASPSPTCGGEFGGFPHKTPSARRV